MKKLFLYAAILIGTLMHSSVVFAQCECDSSGTIVPVSAATDEASCTALSAVSITCTGTDPCECQDSTSAISFSIPIVAPMTCPSAPIVIGTCQWTTPVTPVASSTFTPPESIQLINPLTGTTNAQDIPAFVGGIIQRLLGILGSISLVVFMYGAFKWITSEGESDDIAEGTHTMAYAAIGILVIFASYGILQSVIGGITGG